MVTPISPPKANREADLPGTARSARSSGVPAPARDRAYTTAGPIGSIVSPPPKRISQVSIR